jgi:glycerol-3-phosphate O-acyltransferase/dihydroxyacetone phosphate acyltransferase
VVGPFLRALHALPVQRRQDAGSDMARNETTFESCERALAEGEAIALFPEGISHSEPNLQPLKTGAARIAGRTRSAGATGLAVLPVGLIYEAKTVFRSDVTAVVGLPVEHDDLDWDDGESPAAVEAFTDRLDRALRSVTVNAETWEDLRFVEGLRGMALEILGPDAGDVPPPQVRSRMLEGYYRAREERPEALQSLLRRARQYFRTLGFLGLEDADLAREVTLGDALAYARKRLALAILTYPPALFGWLFNALPYYATGPLALYFAREEDLIATYKLGIGALCFTLYYALAGTLLGWALGPWPALAILAAAVPAGLWALAYAESGEAFIHRAKAVLALWTRARTAARLRRMREEVLDVLRPLVFIYQ